MGSKRFLLLLPVILLIELPRFRQKPPTQFANLQGEQTLPLSTGFLEQEMKHNIESDLSYHADHDADRHLPGIVYDPGFTHPL